MRRRVSPAPALLATTALMALTMLAGCATFGGNVKGSFSCEAPDGICAPSSSIDDRALAMITGEGVPGETVPAASSPAVRSRVKASRVAAAGSSVPLSQVDPRRTQERVLRIIFQPYIDGRGRLHEASAVHAVVQSGEWEQQTLAGSVPLPDRDAAIASGPNGSLAEAVDRADLAGADAILADPNVPDPAAVAAARARRADPIKAIQNDVATRLSPKAGRTPVSPSTAASADRQVEGESPSAMAPAPVSGGDGTGSEPAAAPAHLATKPKGIGEAIGRIKGSPEYQAAARKAESDAMSAAAGAASPQTPVKARSTVRAPGFPAAAPGEN